MYLLKSGLEYGYNYVMPKVREKWSEISTFFVIKE